MFPDEKIMCHHTSFEKRCFDLVVHSKCRKWQQLLGVNPQTGEQLALWDCVDGHAHRIQLDTGAAVMRAVASIDKLVNEVAKANDTGMAHALAGINANVARIGGAAWKDVVRVVDATAAPKLIGSD